MSTIHTVVPYSNQFKTEQFRKWFGRDIPSNMKDGCLPSWQVVETILEEVAPEGYEYEYGNDNIATFKAINNSTYEFGFVLFVDENPEAHIQTYSFRGNRILIEKVFKGLPETYGSFLIMTNGEKAKIVTANGEL